MRKILSHLGSILGSLISIALIAVWITGSLHAERKHDEGYLPWFLFPWGIYRGVEQFWHDDYANIDWDKKLSTDINSCIYLMTEGASKEANLLEVNDGIDKLEHKFKSYPKEKRDFVANGCRAFVKYSTYDTKELIIAMDGYYETGKFVLPMGDTTRKYKEEMIVKYKQEDYIKTLDSSMQIMISQLDTSKINDPARIEELKQEYHKKIAVYMNEARMKMQSIFHKIFNEEL